MIGKLIFKLPEERPEFEQAQRAGKAEGILFDLYQMLRTKSKYQDEDNIKIDELRDWLNTECSEAGIDI